MDTFCDMSWSHITGLFLQDHKTPLLLALEHAMYSSDDDNDDYSDIVKMLLEKGAVYDVKDEVSYAVYRSLEKIHRWIFSCQICSW